jgi:hypothetical protein
MRKGQRWAWAKHAVVFGASVAVAFPGVCMTAAPAWADVLPTERFEDTGTYAVPERVSHLRITAVGAAGGIGEDMGSSLSGDGGLGAVVIAELDVEPGQAFDIVVGTMGAHAGNEDGQDTTSLLAGGAGGVGAGTGGHGGGGGGATGIRLHDSASWVVVEGGGGGGGGASAYAGDEDEGDGGSGGTAGLAGQPGEVGEAGYGWGGGDGGAPTAETMSDQTGSDAVAGT